MAQLARERTAEVLPDGKPMTRREVAVQSGVSASYVTRLEDGTKSPSKQILARVMACLAFTPAEARQAYKLLGYEDTPPEPDRFDPGPDREYIEQLAPAVVGIIDPYWGVRAANSAYEHAFPGITAAGNVLKWMFQDQRSRETMVEWADETGLTVSWLKTTTALNPADDRLFKLYDDLSDNEDFLAMYSKPGFTAYRGKPIMLIRTNGSPRMLNVRLFDHPLARGMKFYIATDM